MRILCLSMSLAVFATVAPVSAQAVSDRYQIDIPRQALDGALKQFAQQTGLQVARFSDTVDGAAVVGPLNGNYPAEDALSSLLQSSGYAYRRINERTIAVVEPGVVQTPANEPRSDATHSGLPAVLAQVGPSSEVALPQSEASTPLPAGIPVAQADSAARAKEAVEELVVTGTRVANRSVLDTAVPVDIISGDALRNLGVTEVSQALSVAVPSYNFPRPGLADGTDTIRPATLRGLAPDQTLVLVNGKRRHAAALVNVNGTIGRGAAAVDLNTIPAAIVRSIEVLRDGASAQYGSDAIAGVLNVRLKDSRDGGDVTLSTSFHKYSIV